MPDVSERKMLRGLLARTTASQRVPRVAASGNMLYLET